MCRAKLASQHRARLPSPLSGSNRSFVQLAGCTRQMHSHSNCHVTCFTSPFIFLNLTPTDENLLKVYYPFYSWCSTLVPVQNDMVCCPLKSSLITSPSGRGVDSAPHACFWVPRSMQPIYATPRSLCSLLS